MKLIYTKRIKCKDKTSIKKIKTFSQTIKTIYMTICKKTIYCTAIHNYNLTIVPEIKMKRYTRLETQTVAIMLRFTMKSIKQSQSDTKTLSSC
jgi:hypothetical protein